jgi:hypothetical protein
MKGAETDMLSLTSRHHTSTLPTPDGYTDTGRHVCVSSSSTDLRGRFPATYRSAAQIVSPCRHPWIEGAEAGAGETLVACGLAGLSALEGHYAGVNRRAQCEAARPARPHRSDGREKQTIGSQ